MLPVLGRERTIRTQDRKKDWTPSSTAFHHLLAWLDEGVDSGGERYLDIRRRLASYFDRKGCRPADELADETINRVARRLEEEGSIPEVPAHYCYIVARYVFMEHLRKIEQQRDQLSMQRVDPAPAGQKPSGFSDEEDDPAADQMLAWLERCLAALSPGDRSLILGYYGADPGGRAARRRALAVELRMTPNALSIRACRIRNRLEDCVRKASENG